MPFANPHPLYSTWQNMRSRCRNPKNPFYHNYGGKGVSVCDRWDDFRCFVSDVGSKPSPTHTLDRIDNDGNYDPSNVKWSTKSEQARNMRKTSWVTIEGTRYRASDLADIAGVRARTIIARVQAGLPYIQVVAPQHRKRTIPTGMGEKAWEAKRNQTHCKRGHPLSGDNVYMTAGSRSCIACKNETRADWRAKRKALGLPVT
jgi:hypothetical protein